MGKNNNLTKFLTDVANAIREKKGSADLINPQDFSSEIKSIESGSPESGYNDITFFDYDGKIVYSYTWNEFVAKNELPPMPQHKGLTSVAWNWTIEDILEQPNHKAIVGLLVKPDDDSSRLMIAAYGKVEIDVIAPAEGLTVNWGDGVTETYTEGSVTMKHEYSAIKEYDVRIKSNGDNIVNYGFGSSTSDCFFRGEGTIVEANWNNCRLSQGCMYNLKRCVLSGYNTNINLSSFALINPPCFVVHESYSVNNYWATGGPDIYVCANSGGITNSGAEGATAPFFIAPKGLREIGYGGLSRSQYIYIDVSNNPNMRMPGLTFQSNNKLQKVLLPGNLTTIPSSMANGCSKLQKIAIPSKVTTVQEAAFNGCSSLLVADFTKVEMVPTLTNVSAFTGTTCSIVVPDALYDEWVVATNWATYASRIVKASEFVEPINE